MNEPPSEQRPTFVITKPYRQFVEFCDACRRQRYIGLCHGVPGVGKTVSARHYARWDQVEAVLPYLGYTAGPVVPVPDLGERRVLVYTPPVANTPKQLDRDLQRLHRRVDQVVGVVASGGPPRVDLVNVDEADRLKMLSLEQLRDRYDRGQHGLILIGMPGIEKRLARYAQLFSRVGFVHEFQPLGDEEVRFLLEEHWAALGLRLSPRDFTDREALATIIRVTGGNFRLLLRLFTQIERILRINERRTVTSEVVETARSSLVIGAPA